MAAQNSGGQRGQRQESGNDNSAKSTGGQRGKRQEPGNDHSRKNPPKKSGSGDSDPGKKNNAIEKSQKDLGG